MYVMHVSASLLLYLVFLAVSSGCGGPWTVWMAEKGWHVSPFILTVLNRDYSTLLL